MLDLHNQGDPYSGIYSFGGTNCCSGQHCRRIIDDAAIEPVARGYYIIPTGELVTLPDLALSPDEHFHICRNNDAKKELRCLLIPDRGT